MACANGFSSRRAERSKIAYSCPSALLWISSFRAVARCAPLAVVGVVVIAGAVAPGGVFLASLLHWSW